MKPGATLEAVLDRFERRGQGLQADVAQAVRGLAETAVDLRRRIELGPLGGAFAEQTAVHTDGDIQKALDLAADEMFLAAARRAPVACYLSEEGEAPLVLACDKSLALAIDPLDGSSNIGANAPMGTIFSLFPAGLATPANPAECFLQPGTRQLAAGFFLYGPQLTLMLTLGEGTLEFVRSPMEGFVLTRGPVVIPKETSEFAINASNRRHWDEPVRRYVDDCLAGADGPRERDFNTRWLAAAAGEAHRILARGGVFLYPADARRGYRQGRLRLLYEANPIAFLIEQAGGAATDGLAPIMSLRPTGLHARTPLVFGSADEVARIARYHAAPHTAADCEPLFGQRGLFRR